MKGRLTWAETPKTSPKKIADHFVSGLRGTPGVLRVWAEVRGHTIHFTILTSNDREVRGRVYDAERETRRAFADASVEFDVIHESEWLPPELEEAVTVYAAT